MSYQVPTFPLVNRVGMATPVANVDVRYGPWLSLNDALTGFNPALRFRGLTVGIYTPNNITTSPVIEYWWKSGTTDNDLILKQPEETNQGKIKILSNNEFTLSASSFSSFFKSVTSSNDFTFSNFVSGTSITLYVSANHVGYFRHYVPQTSFIGNAGEGNTFFSFENKITKLTLQNTGNYFIGIAEPISFDVIQVLAPTGDSILLDAYIGYLKLENGDYILLD
jgi:hypothetical protein